MKSINITIFSKNQNSLNDFFFFCTDLYNTKYLKSIKHYFTKKRRKKILTILKSPHVNKDAQEQFETKIFFKQFTIRSTQNFKYLIFLKKIKYYMFPDIKIKVKVIINKKNIESWKLRIVDPDNFVKKKNSNCNSFENIKIKNLLKIFYIYGFFGLKLKK
jgi:ribosomal protein S10